VLGLAIFGAGVALIIESRLGASPWDVFHQGVSRRTGISVGNVIVIVGLLLLVLWIPLRQRPGVGTILNAVEIGLTADLFIAVLPQPAAIVVRWMFLAAGLVAIGLGSGLYIGAGLGTGPRDGIMMGLAKRGVSVRVARTIIEATAVLVGWLLGGRVGLGTVAVVLCIGPLVQFFLPMFRMPPRAGDQLTVTGIRSSSIARNAPGSIGRRNQ
jgi:uncharacterized membrane protein YczE